MTVTPALDDLSVPPCNRPSLSRNMSSPLRSFSIGEVLSPLPFALQISDYFLMTNETDDERWVKTYSSVMEKCAAV